MMSTEAMQQFTDDFNEVTAKKNLRKMAILHLKLIRALHIKLIR